MLRAIEQPLPVSSFLHPRSPALCDDCIMQSLHSAITPPTPPTARPPVFSYPPRNPAPDAYPHHHTLCAPPDLTPTRGTRPPHHHQQQNTTAPCPLARSPPFSLTPGLNHHPPSALAAVLPRPHPPCTPPPAEPAPALSTRAGCIPPASCRPCRARRLTPG